MTRKGPALSVTAMDAVTGRTLWSRPASPSAVVPGIDVGFTVLEQRYAVWLEPGSLPGFAHLILVDPRRTGSIVARSDEFRFVSNPGVCDDDARYLCADAESDSGAATYRFRPGMKDLERVTRIDATRIQSIGPKGLVRFTARGAHQSRIGVVRGGRLLWSHSEDELFGAGYSTDGGWTFDEDPASGTYVGSVGPDVDLGDALPLTKSVVSFAIRQSTGAVVWRRPGVDLFCDRDFTGRPADPFIACRWTAGTVTVEHPKPPLRDAAYLLERIDPRTGRAQWSTDMGEPAMTTWAPLDLALGRDFVVAPAGGATSKVVRLDSGVARGVTSADLAWRDRHLTFEGDVPFRARYQTTFERHGTVDEQIVAGAPYPVLKAPLPGTIGVWLDGLAILAVEGRVLAVPSR